MSAYVGIGVHRKRSQVAVIGQDGEVLTLPRRRTIQHILGGHLQAAASRPLA